jgi:hypothetical protein
MAYKDFGQFNSTPVKANDAAFGAVSGGRKDAVSAGLYRMAQANLGGNGTTMRAADAAAPGSRVRAVDAAAPSSSNAFLESELEKRDPLVRKPLTTVTWEDNIPVRTGGGWVEFLSNLNVGYGSAGSDDSENVATGGATIMPAIQGNFGKDIYGTHVFIQPLIINEVDMLRQNVTGRSLDTLLADGVRLNYEKHMDKNVFMGLQRYGTTGLLNNASVTSSLVAQGSASGSPRDWAHKTADEILADVNSAIITVWAAAGNDMAAIPNHILLPFEQFNLLISKKVSDIGQVSIMEFLKANNIVKNYGRELKFGVSLWGKGAGAGSTNRMAVYVHDDKYLAVEELVPLTRMRTMYTPGTVSYDTNYMANISQVEFFYTATIGYFDGI